MMRDRGEVIGAVITDPTPIGSGADPGISKSWGWGILFGLRLLY